MKQFRVRTAELLIAGTLISLLSGCGSKKEATTEYISPSFNNETMSDASSSDASMTDASITDAIKAVATVTDATVTDALPASYGDALPMGVYSNDGTDYYNSIAGFELVTDSSWKLYSKEQVASATDASLDDISNLWSGIKSPKDEETTYCAIANNITTGSNIIISYISPKAFLMPELNASKYLNMACSRYDGTSIGKVDFLGSEFSYLDIPKTSSSVGRRVQLASDQDGLILLITMTLQDSEELTDALSLFRRVH